MSKASEWADKCLELEPKPFKASEARDTVSVSAYVQPDLNCMIVKASPIDSATLILHENTALALAHWILDTFGEAQP